MPRTLKELREMKRTPANLAKLSFDELLMVCYLDAKKAGSADLTMREIDAIIRKKPKKRRRS